MHLGAPSIGFVCVCRNLSPNLRVGSQVFDLLMLFLCVSLHIMWSGKSLQLLCILPFGILWLWMFVKILLAVCMSVVCAKVDYVPSVNCVQSGFL